MITLLIVVGSRRGALDAATRNSFALPSPAGCPTCYHPAVRTTWQWQLTGWLDSSVRARIYDIDLFERSRAQVRMLHGLRRKAICYIDAGSWEDWRPDRASFPKAVIGRPLAGWPGERWLNIRKLSVLGPIMRRRVTLCKQKQFDGVEFDNVDAWQNATGFHITATEQLLYNIFLANLAHTMGLSVALKNDTDQARRLLPYFDWSLDEQCFMYRECDKLLPFIRAGKPVFEVEYSLPVTKFCPRATKLRFNSMRKHLALGPWLQRCGQL